MSSNLCNYIDYGVELIKRKTVWLQTKVSECKLRLWHRLYAGSVCDTSAAAAAVCGLCLLPSVTIVVTLITKIPLVTYSVAKCAAVGILLCKKSRKNSAGNRLCVHDDVSRMLLQHSCDPNVFVQNVFVDTHDLRFPWVAFFALQ